MELHCNSKRRKLGPRGIRKHRRDRERDKKVKERETERRLDKGNALEGKTTQDCCFFLQPGKRFETHLLFREEP